MNKQSDMEREKFLNKNGVSSREIERWRTEEIEVKTKIEERGREIQGQLQYNKILNSKYNKRYKKIRNTEIPRYLTKLWKKEELKVIASFRCGNGERGNMYWREEEDRKCRICEKGRETIEHLQRDCEGLERTEGNIEEILNDQGTGVDWLIKINKERKKKEKEEKSRNNLNNVNRN